MKRCELTCTRRDFCQSLGLTTAGVLTASLPVWAKEENKPSLKKPWRMKLSTSSIHFMQLPIEQACEQIANLGFEAIDIWSAHAGCPHLDDVLNRLGPEGLTKLLKKYKLKLCAFSVYSGGYQKYAKLLGKVGAEVAVGGRVAVRGSTRPCKPEEITAKMKQFLESLKPLADLAEKYDSYLAIENHGNALLDSLDSFKAFVDLNKSKRLGIALAPYHLQTIKASVPEAIRISGKQLFFFYAWQRAPKEKQLPGVGPTDMTPWLQALAEIKYLRYVNPFMHGHPKTEEMIKNLKTSRDYLQQCYSKIRQKT